MKDKKTVFVLGAGASCPYGYPSGSRLREIICHPEGFMTSTLNEYRIREKLPPDQDGLLIKNVRLFTEAFRKARIETIDKFMACNAELAPTGKYIIAFEIFKAEKQSLFGEEAKHKKERLNQSDLQNMINQPLFLGDCWYSYLYNRLIDGTIRNNTLPDFSNANLAFITFNYDRSLEHFLYESLCNLFTKIAEEKIVEALKQLKIIHVYGQIAPLKWQDTENGVDYKPEIHEFLLQSTSQNINTIYEEKQNPELEEAKGLLKQADRIFFLGFGYAKENMDVLGLPNTLPDECSVYGTAFGLYDLEIDRAMVQIKKTALRNVIIKNIDCLTLLRNYF